MPLDNKAQPLFPKSLIDFSKSQDFANTYANNVFFESSFWDLRMIFGQNDQQLGLNAVVQHTAVTIPWPQVKVMKYFLDSHLLTYETQNGRIHIPPNIIPAVPDELPKEVEELDPKAREIWDAVKATYDSFIKANPEASANSANKSKKL
jgi:hypothetical protein